MYHKPTLFLSFFCYYRRDNVCRLRFYYTQSIYWVGLSPQTVTLALVISLLLYRRKRVVGFLNTIAPITHTHRIFSYLFFRTARKKNRIIYLILPNGNRSVRSISIEFIVLDEDGKGSFVCVWWCGSNRGRRHSSLHSVPWIIFMVPRRIIF